MSKILKFVFISITSIFVLIFSGLSVDAILRGQSSINACKNFDSKSFKNATNCTTDDLNLLVDIGNCNLLRRHRNANRFIKWESDIKVEITDIERLSENEISDVDSIIKLMTPLIAPVKIYRVEKNGNFRIHLRLEKLPYKDAMGCAFINIYWGNYKIQSADVYESKWVKTNTTFIHEFLHGLGLSHPRKTYPFNLTMGTQDFSSIEESEKYAEQKHPLSEQEKQVLKMLYSPMIKSGLKIECFKEKIEK
jgi:hypothetical protein